MLMNWLLFYSSIFNVNLFFSLEKADHLMLGHKKLKNENIRLQKQNEKLQNDL